jgi:tRNA pseudouridine55 synthase
MVQIKRIRRPINGVILLDKPLGLSSNQALQKVRYLLNAEKAGHTGSLDPLATGVLPLCFGEATKYSHFLLEADKTYWASIRLGVTTATGDAEGEVLQSRPVEVDPDQIRQVLSRFIGHSQQLPPMYSALKFQGKSFYEYAREGLEIPRQARDIRIDSIEWISYQDHVLQIKVACSKGTYIRTLGEDIGEALGCGGHLVGLRRLAAGHFNLQDTITLEALEAMSLDERDSKLLPVDSTIVSLPRHLLNDTQAELIMHGQPIYTEKQAELGLVRLYNEQGLFLGVGEQQFDKLVPKRLLKFDVAQA